MEELLRALLENSSGLVAYGTVFSILIACGLGLPLPEDISLVLGGFLAHQGDASLLPMIAVGLAGILGGDSLVYLLGRRLGRNVGKQEGRFLTRWITPERRHQVEKLFYRHGEKVVMVARFLPGLRAVTFFTAGSAGMPYRRFIFFDGVAALVSAPVFVFLGYRFGGELETLIEKIKQGQLQVIGAVALVVAAVLLFKWARRRAQKRSELAPAAEVLPSPGANEPM